MKSYFYLKPVMHRAPMKWGREPVIRYEHYIVVAVDQATVIERPAKVQDAIDFPRQFNLYRRRLKGPRGGMRKQRRATHGRKD